MAMAEGGADGDGGKRHGKGNQTGADKRRAHFRYIHLGDDP